MGSETKSCFFRSPLLLIASKAPHRPPLLRQNSAASIDSQNQKSHKQHSPQRELFSNFKWISIFNSRFSGGEVKSHRVLKLRLNDVLKSFPVLLSEELKFPQSNLELGDRTENAITARGLKSSANKNQTRRNNNVINTVHGSKSCRN